MTNRERDKAFKRERTAQRRAYAAARSDTLQEIARILKAGRERVAAELAATPTDFQSWHLPKIQASIDREMAAVSRELGKAAAEGVGTASASGVALIDEPLKAGGIRLSAVLTEIDSRQVSAIRSFMVDKMADVAVETAAKIKTEIGVVMIGADTPANAIGRIAKLAEGGRGRALTIVRTEMGRAFSVAGQERMTQAREAVPGLRKQWRRSGKLHSRVAHDLADGQIVDIDKPFTVNGVALMYPRDPKADAAETVNCGCESLPYMEHWDVTHKDRSPITDDEALRNPKKRDLARALNPPADDAGIRALESLPPARARKQIATQVASGDFKKFLDARGSGEHRPVGLAPDDVARAIESKSSIVRLSSYTVAKQRDRRRGQAFTAKDYAVVQRALDEGTVLRETRETLQIFVEDGGGLYRAVLKATTDRRELYLQSLHRSNDRQRARAAKRLERIR